MAWTIPIPLQSPPCCEIRPRGTPEDVMEMITDQGQQTPVREIAERFLAFHMDGTVIATAEVLGLNLDSLWDQFYLHHDPTIHMRTEDPTVRAYLVVKGFEDWCMHQLADSYENQQE